MAMMILGCSRPPVTVPSGVGGAQGDERVGASLGDGPVVGLGGSAGDVVEGVEELAGLQTGSTMVVVTSPSSRGAGDHRPLRTDPFGLVGRIGMRLLPLVGGLSGVFGAGPGEAWLSGAGPNPNPAGAGSGSGSAPVRLSRSSIGASPARRRRRRADPGPGPLAAGSGAAGWAGRGPRIVSRNSSRSAPAGPWTTAACSDSAVAADSRPSSTASNTRVERSSTSPSLTIRTASP